MDSPMGLGEKHAQQNFNERGGEFQPPWFCWGGHFFSFFPLFFSSIPVGCTVQPPSATHRAGLRPHQH